jgi:hypothetical protein
MKVNPLLPDKFVCLETPFWSTDVDTVARNLRYLAWCIRDCYLNHNEAVYAGHGLGPLGIVEQEHRHIGLGADMLALDTIRRAVFYVDLGFSPGMLDAALHAARHNQVHPDNQITAELRGLPPDMLFQFEAGKPPDSSVYAIPRPRLPPPKRKQEPPCWCESCGELGVDSRGVCMFCGHRHQAQEG